MANEIEVHGIPGMVLYGIVRNANGEVWRPATPGFESYNAANYANYATAIALTEQGATGVFLGSFPTDIAVAGSYRIDVRRQLGGSPAVSDLAYGGGSLKWSGTAEIVDGDVNVVQWRGTQPNALAGGRIDASVGAMANDVITAAVIATNAIDADAVAASAVTEIQAGLATSTDVTNIIAAIPSSGAISDAVWDEATAGHQTAGSTGAALSAAGNAGDPWSTELPGSYSPGEAGYIVGHNLDAQISDLLGQGISPPFVTSDCGDVQYFDAGETKLVYDNLVATNGGTFTIQSATATLRDGAGMIVYGINGVPVTGFDSGARQSSRAWYSLNTGSPPTGGPIAIGNYELEFVVLGVGSDTYPRRLEKAVVIVVQ